MQLKKLLKFCSWNIEGLLGKLDDEEFLTTINSFDCITLVENWLKNDSTVNIQGFYSFSKCRQKHDRAWRNSGGITVLVGSELRKGIRFFDKESNEQFIWWKLDKDFFHMKRDLFICSVYIPPQNSPRERRLDRDHFQSLQENIYKFSKLGSIILCGDLNARIGDLDDCIKNTSVLEDFFPSTCPPNGSIEIESRNSKDNHCNSYGKLLAELCCGNDLILLNGRTKGDYIGQFTCQTYNGASVVDYTIVSSEVMSEIKYFTVSEITHFSHHCFLSFGLETESYLPLRTEKTLQLSSLPMSFMWNDALKTTLRENLSNTCILNEMNTLFQSPQDQDVDSLVNEFTNIIIKVSKKVIKIKNRRFTKKKQKSTMQNKKWFDKSCHVLKNELRNLGSLLSRFPDNNFLRHKFFSTKKEYKRLVKRLKRNFKNEMLSKIQSMEEYNPKEFWKLVKSIKSNNSNSIEDEISPAVWYDYFKNLNEKKVTTENSRNETQFVRDYRLWAAKSDIFQ
ncbi:Hypothetical predicted protein [Paramuricea clavata]|uniref:Uncharacterized protein n=1 Tax=Paramuricea clavata TaxID=317549 RepID=A0A6S7G796_PARCT|nr:Hypothetical predicted protein [Paramuricea clavata]